MDLLKLSVELARISYEAGEFPAGAVLRTKQGKVYRSDPSLPYYHGECMVIDKALKAEGYPLSGAIIYASMEPCLMCSAKMYWAGITEAHFVIPKGETHAIYAYEDAVPMRDHIKNFNTQLVTKNDPTLLDEALSLYTTWVQKIETNA
jgi:guanine deaminase